VGQAAKAVVGRKFLVPEISSLDDADRDAHAAVCPGSWSRRFIRSEDAVDVWANYAQLHALRRKATSLDMPLSATLGDAGDNGENMDNHWEPHETDEHQDTGAYREMEYRLKSLRALVCDLLKTNQELRSALLDAGIDMRGGKAASCRARPRPLV
jgi:hypothetical protein